MEFLGDFFLMYDIDIHQLNLGKLKIKIYLDEISPKKCEFLYLFNIECLIIFYF